MKTALIIGAGPAGLTSSQDFIRVQEFLQTIDNLFLLGAMACTGITTVIIVCLPQYRC